MLSQSGFSNAFRISKLVDAIPTDRNWNNDGRFAAMNLWYSLCPMAEEKREHGTKREERQE